MPGRHQRKIFASPIGTATPNTVYTQQRAKPACQEDINNTKLLRLLTPQLPQKPRPSGDQGRRNPFWRLWVLRLSGDQARRNPFSGAPQPLLEALSTASACPLPFLRIHLLQHRLRNNSPAAGTYTATRSVAKPEPCISRSTLARGRWPRIPFTNQKLSLPWYSACYIILSHSAFSSFAPPLAGSTVCSVGFQLLLHSELFS